MRSVGGAGREVRVQASQRQFTKPGEPVTGEQGTELVSELTVARRLDATPEEINCLMHAHATMHETAFWRARGGWLNT